jgi:hypothetical protein
MRQIKYLIKEAKQNTNTVDAEAISDAHCVRLLNRSQSFIQAYIYNQNVSSRILRATSTFDTQMGIDTYELPFNVYATNGIVSVQQKVISGLYTNYFNIKRITDKNRGDMLGYLLSDNKMILTPMPQQPQTLVVTYTRTAPSIGISYGTISAVTPTTLTLAVGYQDMTGVDDYFTVVNFDGEIIARKLIISQTGNTLTLSDTTDILVGMFVVPGEYSSTHCSLPNEFEAPLIMALETLINARLSSSDIPVSKAFSEMQLDQIAEMYAEDTSDAVTPPVVEFKEWV